MKPVFFEVDVQYDFMTPAGALYVPGAESILGQVARLNRWAAGRGITVVSTMDAHLEQDPEFAAWPGHCVAGTLGQRKPEATLIGGAVTAPPERGNVDIRGARQVLLEKRALDCFTNPNLEDILAQLQAASYTVYGVVTEYCVKFAALGLLATGRPVTIVTDAIKELDGEEAEKTLRAFTAAGGRLAAADEICAG
jgi:nicotinamidase/pyrazinamidase